jgi:hypothetical protein
MGGWRGHGGNCVESPQAINSNPIKSSKSQKSSLAVLYDNYLKMYETAELKLGKDFNASYIVSYLIYFFRNDSIIKFVNGSII